MSYGDDDCNGSIEASVAMVAMVYNFKSVFCCNSRNDKSTIRINAKLLTIRQRGLGSGVSGLSECFGTATNSSSRFSRPATLGSLIELVGA